MYLLLSIPNLQPRTLRLPPKALVPGSKQVLEDLKVRINKHENYEIGNSNLDEWNAWFREVIPEEENVHSYIRNHRYECPLVTFFRQGFQHDPIWQPSLPKVSFSIFPAHVVVALPSVQCQFDHQGPAAPYMAIEMGTAPDDEASVITRYNDMKALEFNRLKKLKRKGLLHIVNRKVKEHGSRFATSGLTIEKLCALVFDCDLNFFLSRLSDDFDHEQSTYIQRIFEGGEALHLNSSSPLVTIGVIVLTIETLRSFSSAHLLLPKAMDALMELCRDRDKQLCEAHKIVNERKQGYIPRLETLYLKSNVANILFSNEISISAAISSLDLSTLFNERAFTSHYRILIPYFWSSKKEWILVIADNFTREIHIVFTKYSNVELYASTLDEREALTVFLSERLLEVLAYAYTLGTLLIRPVEEEEIDERAEIDEGNQDPVTATAPPTVLATPQAWKVICQQPEKTIPMHCNRTPQAMKDCHVSSQEDSGIYIAHAIECDYFDAPIYAQEGDWTTIRKRFAYCILSNQLQH